MNKKFFEVFPTLQLDKKLKALLESTEVERVTSNRAKDMLRIYLQSDHLLQKETVWEVEEKIRGQLFPSHPMEIKIQEKYVLSSQYTLENLMESYRESILLEIQKYNHVLHSMFKQAKLAFPQNGRMVLTIKDTVLYRDLQEELIRILEKIIVERCGVSASLSLEFVEMEGNRHREDDEIIIRRKIEEISRKVAGLEVFQSENDGETAQAVSGEKADQVTEKKADASKIEQEKGKNGNGGSNAFKENKGKDDNKDGKSDYRRPLGLKHSDNPDVIYGRDFEDEAMPISEIIGEIGEVTIRGKIIALDMREIRNEKTILFFDVTDFTDTMTIKVFTRNDQLAELTAEIKKGAFIKLKGLAMVDKFDGELTIGSLVGIKKIKNFTSSRMDHSVKKRVELHCHTKMSDMDGVSEAKDIVKRAYAWGHPAIAITDHGVVQSFPDANHVWEDLWRAEKAKRKEAGEENPDKNDFFKVIYGVEAYLVDDLNNIVTNENGQSLEGIFVVFDIETTGFSPVKNRIIEIGAVKVSHGEVVDHFSAFVNPQVPIPYEITKLTGINDEMVMDAKTIEEVLPEFVRFCEGAVLVAHNANFDMSFINENIRRQRMKVSYTYIDTLGLARVLLPGQAKHTLDAVCKTLKISLENHHRAVDDASATAQMFIQFIDMLKVREISSGIAKNGILPSKNARTATSPAPLSAHG